MSKSFAYVKKKFQGINVEQSTHRDNHAMIFLDGTAASEEGDNKHNQANDDQNYRSRCVETLIR